MAKIHKNFEFKVNDKSKLPWDLWLDGQTWEVALDETNYSSLSGLIAALWQNAKRRGKGVQTQRNNKTQTVVFRAYDKE